MFTEAPVFPPSQWFLNFFRHGPLKMFLRSSGPPWCEKFVYFQREKQKKALIRFATRNIPNFMFFRNYSSDEQKKQKRSLFDLASPNCKFLVCVSTIITKQHYQWQRFGLPNTKACSRTSLDP